MAEFLPLCDVLFNVISMAGYFCDVVFDVVMGYALLERGYKGTFAAAMSIIITSLVISQVLSLRWYLHVWWAGEGRTGRLPWLPVALHCLQLGVLWRYARLLVPVSLRHVKHQVRDLCMLRLVHAFCEAAPMLLLQLHVALRDAPDQAAAAAAGEPAPAPPHHTANVYEVSAAGAGAGAGGGGGRAFAELAVISASLSLFSVCWALASFSKNVRLHNVHRLVLTWLGVIFQFLWRLGTISARVCALTVYALVYEYWVFLVIGLHWVSMFLWLISPKNAFHGERISRARKAYLSALIAFVYVFAYVNLQELNHRQKMVTFYCVMCVENCLLVVAWWCAAPRPRAAPLAAAAAAFVAGLLFMLLYYRYFHVRRLGYMLGERQQGTNSTNGSADNNNGKPSSQADNAAIPGVFNCRFSNPVGNSAANGRKKKKPTSFVPPPAAPATPATPAPAPATAFWRRPLPAAHNHHGGSSENEGSSVGSRVNIQQKLHEKKQKQLAELRVIEEEIKQGKLAHTAPVAVDEIYTSLQRQPIPRAKTHAAEPAWPAPAPAPAAAAAAHPYQNYPAYPTYAEIKAFAADEHIHKSRQQSNRYGHEARSPDTAPRSTFYENPPLRSTYLDVGAYNVIELNAGGYESSRVGAGPGAGYCGGAAAAARREGCAHAQGCAARTERARRALRCRTPEILLAPHYLDGCCQWGAPYSKKEECGGGGGGVGSSGEGSVGGPARETPRPPSDIDSQISLPRSYTLPREFRYWRRRPRLHAHAHAPSNNSSDGDVDSADNDSDRRSNCSAASQLQSPTYGEFPYRRHEEHERRARRPHALRKQAPKPETKL